MRITVIIPCHNGENYLREAIGSVNGQDTEKEVLVVDDGSTDGTAAVAAACGAKVFSISHGGAARARNYALAQVSGEAILFLDHDDLLVPGALQELSRTLQCDPEIDYVQARMKDFVSPELSEKARATLFPRVEPYFGTPFGTTLFRASRLRALGGLDPSLRTGEGVDLLLRCARAGLKARKIDFVAVHRRLHSLNTGRIMRAQENRDYAEILRRRLKQGWERD